MKLEQNGCCGTSVGMTGLRYTIVGIIGLSSCSEASDGYIMIEIEAVCGSRCYL